jgi:hypothetical protein
MRSLVSKLKRRDSSSDTPGTTPARNRQGSDIRGSTDNDRSPTITPESSSKAKNAELFLKLQKQEDEINRSEATSPKLRRESLLLTEPDKTAGLFPDDSPAGKDKQREVEIERLLGNITLEENGKEHKG